LISPITLTSMAVAGFLSGAHCGGMCGGMVGAFALHFPVGGSRWAYHGACNVGRIASYTAAGAIAGTLGSAITLLQHMAPVQALLGVLANLTLIAMGLYIAGVSRWVARLERAGAVLWRLTQPRVKALFPVTTLPRALWLGVLWGWMPCGLVYSALLTGLASADTVQGGALMLAYGIGTLPNLLAFGLCAGQLQRWLRLPAARCAAGVLIIASGVAGLMRVEQGLQSPTGTRPQHHFHAPEVLR
jgi:uncharacterized protein